jgi:outer membrane beta-barrel protein
MTFLFSKTSLVVGTVALVGATAVPAFAQKKKARRAPASADKAPAQPPADEPEMTFDEDEAAKPAEAPAEEPPVDASADDGGAIDLGSDATAGTEKDVKLGETRESWQDIVTVVRKSFLKGGRLSLQPSWGVTMNDNMMRHMQFAAQLNYFLTDVLAIGLEAELYHADPREAYDVVPRQARRLPIVNKYNYGAALNFHYVPIYGKFAILDDRILQWETYFTAGLGFTQSEVVPSNPAYQSFTNFLITPNVGVAMRFFVTKWLTIDFGLRDYVFVDQYEAANRTAAEASSERGKDTADSSLVNNVIFQTGVSFWIPPSFEYTTFR